jgi:hypothetical protein
MRQVIERLVMKSATLLVSHIYLAQLVAPLSRQLTLLTRVLGAISPAVPVEQGGLVHRVRHKIAVPAGMREKGCRLGVQQLLSEVLGNEAITRDLGDPEARMLIEWLVEEADWLTENSQSEEAAARGFVRLVGRARAISRFVSLWCYRQARGAAYQLVAAERFYWPLPCGVVDPCELMGTILEWETQDERLWHEKRSLAA